MDDFIKSAAVERDRLRELGDQLERGAVGTRPPLPSAAEILAYTREQIAVLDVLLDVYRRDPMRQKTFN